MVITYFIIFVLAALPFFEAAAIIPIAIIGGVPTIPTILTAFIGNMVTIVLLIVFIDKIKAWQKSRKLQKEKTTEKHEELEEQGEQGELEVETMEHTKEVDVKQSGDLKKHKRARKIWDKYGLPGLAFIGPFFVGSHLSAFLATAFGGTRERTLMLMTFSLLFWSVLLGSAAHFGFDHFVADDEDLGFITRLLNLD